MPEINQSEGNPISPSDGTVTIEFVDRYGGNIPSLLRGCHECEAMGWCPVKEDTLDEPWRSLWLGAERKEHAEDGWHFVECPYCLGSGRISWIRTILRIPSWLLKSTTTAWRFTFDRNYHCGNAGFWERLKTSLRICFWEDIKRLWV